MKLGAGMKKRRRRKTTRRPKVYVIRMVGTDYYKIGYTESNVSNRLKQLQTGNPHKLELVTWFYGTTADEGALHKDFAHKRAPAGNEWFALSKLDVLKLKL